MKANKKGFTLIELLAVIVILAIIALIATPIILNVINDAKENASKSSAYGYLESVEKYIALSGASISSYNAPIPADGTTCTIADGVSSDCKDFIDAVNATAKGEKPKSASLTISGGMVTGTIEMPSHSTVWTYNGTELS